MGYIGICEVSAEGVGQPALIRFRSPLCQDPWEDWVAACEDYLDMVHSTRSTTERERLQNRWDVSDDVEQHNRLFGFSPIPDPFPQAEYRRPEPEPFAQVWPQLALRLAGKIITAYNASYDQAALDGLLQATHLPMANFRWLDGRAVARNYKYWVGQYGSPTEKLWRELFDWEDYSEGDTEYRGERLQDVTLRLELFTGEQARLRALAHREWGIGNKALLRDAAEDAWANAEIIAAALRSEGLPVTTDGIDILDAVIVDPDPTVYPAHQTHLASIEPIDPVCAQFLTTRAQAQVDRCISRICGIHLSPNQWTEVYAVWESAARWLMRLVGVSELEQASALAAEADRLIQASHSVLVCHQRGKVYADALWCWLEANRKQLAFHGLTDEEIKAQINRLCADEEQDRAQRRRRKRTH